MNSTHPERKNLLFYLDIIENGSRKVIGQLGDISPEGLLLISSYHLPLNKVYSVSILLPDTDDFSKTSIDAYVETRWRKPDDNPNIYRIGCMFAEISEEDKALIADVQQAIGWDAE